MCGASFERKTRGRSILSITLLVATSLLAASAQTPPNRGVAAEGSGTTSSPHDHGTYYALVIGINNYQNLPKLETPVSDALAIKQVLESRYGFQVQLLTDPPRYQILAALSEYRSKLHENDSLLVYYAGHGQYDAEALKGYWLPVDAERDVDANWIIADDITSRVRAFQARHVLVVSDSCYAGTLTRSIGSTLRPLDPTRYLEKMQAGRSRNLMASGGNEPVVDGGAPGHSIFANALLMGLTGMDEDAFTAMDLFNTFVQRRVVGSSDQIPQYISIPNSGDEEGDFVFHRSQAAPPPLESKGKEPTSTTPSPDDLVLARQRMAAGTYASALPLFQKAAEHGSAEAMVYMGNYYSSAKTEFTGVPKDDSQAVNWYRKAADAGNASGMGELGTMYQAGHGVEEDAWQAMRWYRKAAEAGDTVAMRNLGELYERGIGIELDYRQALSWYMKAAEAGDAMSMVDLGRMYAAGRGVEQDSAQAANWYSKAMASYRQAADGGDTSAMKSLAQMYDLGLGVQRDAGQALNWDRRAAQAGNATAAEAMGQRYEYGRGADKDPAQAITWYRKAAEAGYSRAMEDLGRVYAKGTGVTKDSSQAVYWYRKASDSGSLVAMLSLAGMYRDGDGVVKDEAQAQVWTRKAAQTAEAGGAGTMYTLAVMYAKPGSGASWQQDFAQSAEWFRKSAQAGNPLAMMSMGSIYENGRGVEKDNAQAIDWYRKAANAGNVQGMLALGRAYRDGIGVQKDDAQALTWFRQATVHGGAPAMYGVGRMYETTGTHDPKANPSLEKDYQQAVNWYGKSATLGYAPAMMALASAYERGAGVERDLGQAASWYRKAASAGYSIAESKLQALGASSKDSGSAPPKLPVVAPAQSGPNFAGTWFEINPRDSVKPRRLVLQQDGGQVTFAGFRLTLNQGIATWTGPQGCAPQLQRSGYNYGSAGVAGTSTLKMSLQGDTLVYENDANWTAPCDGHSIGNEQNISRFRRGEISEIKTSKEGGVAPPELSTKGSFLWVLDRSHHLRIASPSGSPMRDIAPINLDLSVGGNRVLSASRDGQFAVAVNAYDAVDKLVRYDVRGSSPWSIKVGSYAAATVAASGYTYAIKRGRDRTRDVIQKIDSQTGKVEREKEIPQSAFDIVADASGENVWVAGKAITLLDLDLNERWTKLPSDFFYVSIDVAPDGSVLALERKYDQNRGQDRLLRVGINGDVLNSFPLDFMPARVVANRGFWDVWVVGTQVLRFSKESFGRNSSGGNPQRYDIGPATFADVARDGSAWIGARSGLVHLARDGRVLGQVPGLATEKMCIAVVDSRP